MFDPAAARTYAARRTLAELQAIQDACLEVLANSGEVSVSSGSGSISVNASNCRSILADVEEAVRIKAAGAEDPDLTAPAFTTGVGRQNIYIE